MRKALDTPLAPGVSGLADAARRDGAIARIEVHYPDDAEMIVEALRRILRLVAQLERLFSAPPWQRARRFLGSAERLYLEMQKIAGGRRADKKEKCSRLHEQLVAAAMTIVLKAYEFKSKLDWAALAAPAGQRQAEKLCGELQYFLLLTLHLACLAKRQIVDGEVISPEQKISGLSELHKELIDRGKFPFPISLDECGFAIETPLGFGIDFQIARSECKSSANPVAELSLSAAFRKTVNDIKNSQYWLLLDASVWVMWSALLWGIIALLILG